MRDNKELIKKYISLKKECDEIGKEAGLMMTHNLIGTDKWKQLEIKLKHVNDSMNSTAKRFIESFIIE